MMGHGFGGTTGSLAWFLSMLISLLLPVLVIVGIVYVALSLWERRKKGSGEETGSQDPLNILKKRYANGEISKDEFDRIKEDLLKG
ncbi:MAG: putative rane protein [Clostridia bacterium]|nr:putative rane protein [Clostridia bacterium]